MFAVFLKTSSSNGASSAPPMVSGNSRRRMRAAASADETVFDGGISVPSDRRRTPASGEEAISRTGKKNSSSRSPFFTHLSAIFDARFGLSAAHISRNDAAREYASLPSCSRRVSISAALSLPDASASGTTPFSHSANDFSLQYRFIQSATPPAVSKSFSGCLPSISSRKIFGDTPAAARYDRQSTRRFPEVGPFPAEFSERAKKSVFPSSSADAKSARHAGRDFAAPVDIFFIVAAGLSGRTPPRNTVPHALNMFSRSSDVKPSPKNRARKRKNSVNIHDSGRFRTSPPMDAPEKRAISACEKYVSVRRTISSSRPHSSKFKDVERRLRTDSTSSKSESSTSPEEHASQRNMMESPARDRAIRASKTNDSGIRSRTSGRE